MYDLVNLDESTQIFIGEMLRSLTPPIDRFCPVIKCASMESNQIVVLTTSLGAAIRPLGLDNASSFSSPPYVARSNLVIGVSTSDGQTVLIRMLFLA